MILRNSLRIINVTFSARMFFAVTVMFGVGHDTNGQEEHKTPARNLTVESDRTIARQELRKLSEDEAVKVLVSYAKAVSDPTARGFLLEEVQRLSVPNRKWPLSEYAAALYVAGKKEEAMSMVKNHAPDDDCRAAMVVTAAVSKREDSLDRTGKIHLPWLRANTPAANVPTNVGYFFGELACASPGTFGINPDDTFQQAHTALKAAANKNELDEALSAFATHPGVIMIHGGKVFPVAQSIKDSTLRLKTLEKFVTAWMEVGLKDQVAETLDAAKGLSKEETTALRKIVDGQSDQ